MSASTTSSGCSARTSRSSATPSSRASTLRPIPRTSPTSSCGPDVAERLSAAGEGGLALLQEGGHAFAVVVGAGGSALGGGHGGHGGAAQAVEAGDDRVHRLEDRLAVLVEGIGVAQVASGAEPLALAPQQQGPGRVLLQLVEGRGQRRPGRLVEGVAPLRSVEDELGDVAVALD